MRIRPILRIGVAFASVVALTVAMAAWSTSRSAHAANVAPRTGNTKLLNKLYPEAKGKFTSAQCQADKNAGTINVLTGFGFGASPGTIDPIYALDSGLFRKLCLTVAIRSANNQVELISSDAAQVTSQSSAGTIIGDIQTGANIIGTETAGTVLPESIITDPQFKTLKSLEGHTVGYFQNVTNAYISMFEKAGVPASDLVPACSGAQCIKLVDLTNRNAVTDLAEASAFFAFNGSQNIQLNEVGDHNYNDITAASVGLKGVTNVEYMNRKFVAQHPVAAENYMRAQLKALQYCVVNQAVCVTDTDNLAASVGQEATYNVNTNTPEWKFQAGTMRFHGTKPLGTFTAKQWLPEYDSAKTTAGTVAKINNISGSGALPSLNSTFNNKLVAKVYNSKGALIWP